MVFNIVDRLPRASVRTDGADVDLSVESRLRSLVRSQEQRDSAGQVAGSTILRLSQCCLSEFVHASIPKEACGCWSRKGVGPCSHLLSGARGGGKGTYYRAYKASETVLQSSALSLCSLLLYVEATKTPLDKLYVAVEGVEPPPFLSVSVKAERHTLLNSWENCDSIEPGFYVLRKVRNIHAMQQLGPRNRKNGFVFYSPGEETPYPAKPPCFCQLVEAKRSVHRDLLAKLLVRRITAVQKLSRATRLHVGLIQAKVQDMAITYGLIIEMEPFADELPVDGALEAKEWYRRLGVCISTLSRVAMVAASASSQRTGEHVVYFINTTLVQSVIADLEDLCQLLLCTLEVVDQMPPVPSAKKSRSLLTEAIQKSKASASDPVCTSNCDPLARSAPGGELSCSKESSARRNRQRIRRSRNSQRANGVQHQSRQDNILSSLRNFFSLDVGDSCEGKDDDTQSIHLSFWDDADMSLLGVFEQRFSNSSKRQRRRRRRQRVQSSKDTNFKRSSRLPSTILESSEFLSLNTLFN